jgi:phosphonate transport system ATP-binding protein
VSLDGAGFSTGAVEILCRVDLAVSAGERVALVGPSGAGKTTLLKVVSGQLPATAGGVTVGGVDPSGLGPRDRAALVGLVPQGLGLVPQLTVRASLHSGLAGQLGFWRILAALVLPVEAGRARQVAAGLGIDDLLHRRVSSLSGGERQRVAIARLALQAPRVVLADEPVSSVDPAIAEQVIDMLAATSPEGTLMASLHTPDMALRRFDRVVGLAGGQVAFDSPAGKVNTSMLDRLYSGIAT